MDYIKKTLEVLGKKWALVTAGLNAAGVVDGPYPFFKVHDQSKLATMLWMAALLIVAGVLFSLLWLAAR